MMLMKAFLVAVALTLAPIQAWAECAWVLWEEFVTTDFGKSEPTADWRIVQATPDLQDCQKRVEGVINRRAQSFRRPDGSQVTGTVEGNRVSYIGGGVGLIYTYTCIPDTLDPRGPKAGAR
jgi:hypothetical protein